MGRSNTYTTQAALASTAAGINTASSSINLKGWDGCAVVARYTASAPSADAKASTAYIFATNSVTSAAHGFQTGLKGGLATTTTLPTGLSATNYYIIAVNAGAYQFATTQANAEAGTFVSFSNAGTGTHTFTPAAANVVIQYQGSLDDSTFITVSSETVTTTSANVLFNVDRPHYLFARIRFQVNTGQGTFRVDAVKESD